MKLRDRNASWCGAMKPSEMASPTRESRSSSKTLGDVACARVLLWLEFRLPKIGWRAANANLAAWIASIEARPAFAATRPPA
jgi:glutathione S-transferase